MIECETGEARRRAAPAPGPKNRIFLHKSVVARPGKAADILVISLRNTPPDFLSLDENASANLYP